MGRAGEWKGVGDTVNHKEELLDLLRIIKGLKDAYENTSFRTGYDDYIGDVVHRADSINYRIMMEEDDE